MARKWLLISVVLLALFALVAGLSLAQGESPQDMVPAANLSVEGTISTEFTYQGRLMDNGLPANGVYDFRFKLFDARTGGRQVASTITRSNVRVRNGLFTVVLEFGSAPFTGRELWLQTEIRPGRSTGAYTVLSPRQPLYAVPYALSLRPGAKIEDSDTSVQLNKYTRLVPTTTRLKIGLYSTSEGSDSDTRYYGIYGQGTNAGVFGTTDSVSGYGGLFTTSAPGGAALLALARGDEDPDIILGGTSSTADNGVISSDPNLRSSDIVIKSNDNIRIELDNDKNDSDSDFTIVDENNKTVFNVDDSGDISQPLLANGLVKAAVYARCSNSDSSVHRFFNNVNGETVQITNGSSAGECWIDFQFDLSNRFWAGMAALADARMFSCRATGTKLHCFRADENGNGKNGDVMVIVY